MNEEIECHLCDSVCQSDIFSIKEFELMRYFS